MSDHRSLVVLHDEIDEAVAPLVERHADRLECKRGCVDCCVDDLTVFESEANVIRTHYRPLLATGQPHPPGACAFLDEAGACRVYQHRPYVCRTQGLPLRWIDDDAEYRDICPLNDDGEPIESLDEADCWTIGPFEGQLAASQPDLKRVPLRALFERSR